MTNFDVLHQVLSGVFMAIVGYVIVDVIMTHTRWM